MGGSNIIALSTWEVPFKIGEILKVNLGDSWFFAGWLSYTPNMVLTHPHVTDNDSYILLILTHLEPPSSSNVAQVHWHFCHHKIPALDQFY